MKRLKLDGFVVVKFGAMQRKNEYFEENCELKKKLKWIEVYLFMFWMFLVQGFFSLCSWFVHLAWIRCDYVGIDHSLVVLLPQVPPTFSGFPAYTDGGFQMFPVMYPALVPGSNAMQDQEQANHGPGIYAVPVPQFMGPIAGLPSNTLIPLTLNLPT